MLTYADPISLFGVVVEKMDDETRVIVPRVRGWRLVFNGPNAGVMILGWIVASFAATEPRLLIDFPGPSVFALAFAVANALSQAIRETSPPSAEAVV